MHTTITLTSPITVDGREIRELRMREPKVRDRLATMHSADDDISTAIRLLATLCAVPNSAIEDLSLSDFHKLEAAIQDFLALAARSSSEPLPAEAETSS